MRTLVLVILLLCALVAQATHFRYGHVTWYVPDPVNNPRTVRFTVVNSFRRSAYQAQLNHLPVVGDVIFESVGSTNFNYGDGSTTSTLYYRVIAVFAAEDYIITQALNPANRALDYLERTYATVGAAASFTAFIASCCRLSSLINNGDGNYRVEAKRSTGAVSYSPVSSLPAIVTLAISSDSRFTIPVVSNNQNSRFLFRFPTTQESGMNINPPVAGTQLLKIINSATGEMSWNTLQGTVNGLYSTQVVIEEYDKSTNILRSKVAVDFIIKLINCNAPPPSFANSPQTCGSTISVFRGSPVNFVVTATVPSGQVTLNAAGTPSGATMTPTLPFTAPTSASSAFSWTPQVSGVSTLTYVASESTCGLTTLCPIFVRANDCPLASITHSLPITFCANQANTLTAFPAGATYEWNTGATTQSIQVQTTGQYTVTVSNIPGALNCDPASESIDVVALTPPPAVISSTSDSFCSGASLTLSGPQVPNLSYLWAPTTETSSTITVQQAGTYSLTTTDLNGCSSSDQKTIIENPLPLLDVIQTGTLCPGQNKVQLTATTSATVFSWSTGVTTSSIVTDRADTYTVTVTSSDGCTSTKSATVVASALPQDPGISASSVDICVGQTATLTVTNGPFASYLWSTQETASTIIVSNTGIYSVTAYSAEGCTSQSSITITSHTLPNAFIVATSTEFCDGESATLTAHPESTNDDTVSYLWSTNEATRSITVTTGGTYSVTVTSSFGCQQTASIEITKFSKPQPYIVPPQASYCVGSSVSLSAQPSGLSYLWSNGATDAFVTVSQGSYTVTATDPSTRCSATSAPAEITENPLPGVSVSSSSLAFCTGDHVSLAAASNDPTSTFSWSNGQTLSSIVVATAGTFTVTATNANSCQSQASVTIVENALPDATIEASATSFCAGDIVKLSAKPVGGYSYVWSTGSTDQSISVTVGGAYSVKITNSATGCTNTASVTITRNELPVVNAGTSANVCLGVPSKSCVTLKCDCPTVSSASSFTWKTIPDGNTVATSTKEIRACPTQDKTYACLVKDPITGCVGRDQVNVYAKDVSCGLRKVKVCHKTSSSTNPLVELCISQNAIEQHMREHNDKPGACPTGVDCGDP